MDSPCRRMHASEPIIRRRWSRPAGISASTLPIVSIIGELHRASLNPPKTIKRFVEIWAIWYLRSFRNLSYVSRDKLGWAPLQLVYDDINGDDINPLICSKTAIVGALKEVPHVIATDPTLSLIKDVWTLRMSFRH